VQRRFYKRKMKSELKHLAWPFLHSEMVEFFTERPSRDSTAVITAREWPRFVSVEQIRAERYVPGIIWKHGPERRVCFKEEDIHALAFDEPEGHLSHLFSGRLVKVHVGSVEESCVVSHVSADPVDKHLYFVRLARHTAGNVTVVPIPLTMIGLLNSPAYRKGVHVELAMPTVKCEVVGECIPPPFQVDVSQLDYSPPFTSMYLRDLVGLLPEDGTVRFAREYDVNSQEVAWAYEHSKLEEEAPPPDFIDPNWLKKGGRRMPIAARRGFYPQQ